MKTDNYICRRRVKVFCIIMCVLCCILLSSCNKKEENNHRHNVSNWTVEKEATCSATGIEKGSCSTCGEVLKREIAKLPHTEGKWTTTQQATFSTKGIRVKKCTVCQEIIDTEENELSEDEKQKWLKANCKSIDTFDYKDISRYSNSWNGKFVKFKSWVLQVVSENTYRICLRGYRDCVFYMVKKYNPGYRILEDDNITVYGEINGLTTYTTTLGASVTVPKITVYYIENNYGL